MSLLTLKFFIFLSMMFVAYYLIPKRFQWSLLLIGSIFFYLNSSPIYLVFLFISSFTTYYLAKLLKKDKRKIYLILGILINIAILGVLKYTGFVFEIFENITGKSLPEVHFMLPLGISFYTFMVVSYIADVYRGDIEAEENFFKYLLFVSWFPQIIEGPINRYDKMKDSLYGQHDFDFNRCKNAGYRILQGIFKKVVIAGRFGVYVDTVFENTEGCGGLTLFCAVIFYAIQIYADFSGCMDMVLGISELFGVTMTENFDKPFFSKNVSEFWRRWHISLGTWFRDYVYTPVMQSMFCKNLKKKLHNTPLKKWSMNFVAAVSLASVWFLTGVWHGASGHYVFYGVYYGIILIISMFLTKTYKKIHKSLPIKWDSKGYHVFEIIRTLFIVGIGFLIFRANSMREVGFVLKKILTDFSINVTSISEALLPFTGDNTAVSYGTVAVVSAIALFITEIFEYNEKDTFKNHKYINAAVLIIFTLLFGVFGQSGFLYMAY